MKLDNTTSFFLTEIQQEIKKENKVDFSIQEIGEIVNSQFVGANFAFKKGVEVRLPVFGSFIRKHSKKKMDAAEDLKGKRVEIGEEEYQKQLQAFKVKTKKESKIRPDKITIEELKAIPDIVKIKNKYD